MSTEQMHNMEAARRKARLNPKITSIARVRLDHQTTFLELQALVQRTDIPSSARVSVERVPGQRDGSTDFLAITWES